MITYHGKEEIKEKYKQRMLDHIKADELIQGKGFENGKGCFVGCTLNKYSHEAFEDELGIPKEIAEISDAIFEGLSKEESIDFSRDFHDKIKVGVDLSTVWPKFAIEILSNEKHGVLRFVKDEEFKQQKEAIEKVCDLYKNKAYYNASVDDMEAEADARVEAEDSWAAAMASEAEASGAASGAEASGASWAARAATEASWDFVGDAVRAAARAASGAAAMASHYKWMRDLLFKLMHEIK